MECKVYIDCYNEADSSFEIIADDSMGARCEHKESILLPVKKVDAVQERKGLFFILGRYGIVRCNVSL